MSSSARTELEAAAKALLDLRRRIGPKEVGPFCLPDTEEVREALKTLDSALSSNQTDHPQEQAETEIRQYAEWEGAPTQPEDWPAAVPLYKHVGPTGKVVTNPRGAVVSLGLELDKVEQRFYVPVDHPQEPSSELFDQRESLRRLCVRDSTNYAQEERLQHRADLGRVEREIEERGLPEPNSCSCPDCKPQHPIQEERSNG